MITIDLFGDVTLQTDAQSDPVALSPTCQELLGCLILNASSKPINREVLADILWPDLSPDRVKPRLRTALWRLNKAIGPDARKLLVQTKENIAFCLGKSVNLPHQSFSKMINSVCDQSLEKMNDDDFKALDETLKSYKGVLMQRVHSPWILAERERFAELYCQALERQIKYHRAMGRDHRSIRASKRLLAQDPYREDIHSMLISLYAKVGRPQQAMQQYKACQNALELDLGVSTEAARQTLTRALQSVGQPSAKPRTDLKKVIGEIEDGLHEINHKLKILSAALEEQPVKADRVI